MMRAITVFALLFVTACSEAQLCRNAATSPLRSLDRQIAEAEGNISRGFALIAVPGRREYGPEWCPVYIDKDGKERRAGGRCPSPFPPDPDYIERPVNVEAERAKLASLQEQRSRLLPQVQAQLAACPVD